ncbi:MAG TPA: hypothetical protein VII23_02900 [Terriglobales bacterium]
MQLIQIGQTPAQTLQQLIEEMASRQSAEVEQLKRMALERHAAAQLHRKSKARPQLVRCQRSSTHTMKRALPL